MQLTTRGTLFAVMVGVAVGLVVKSFSAAAQQQQQVLRMIIQSHPDAGKKCLQIPGAQYIVGMRLQTFECNNRNEEIFAYDQGTQRLVIGHLCVESWGRGDVADAVGLGACSDAPNQRWKASASGDYYQFVGVNNRCLEIRAGTKDSGAPLDIGNCQTGVASQLWALIEAPTAQAPKCTRVSLDSPSGDIEYMRIANDDWVNHFVDDAGRPGTFNWHVLSENDAELILYDKSRDRYIRHDLFGRKTYARNGSAGGWVPPWWKIIRTDC